MFGEGVNDFLGLEGDGDDFGDELDDVFGVLVFFAPGVGVGGDLGAGVGVDLVLVDDPFECGAVAEFVEEGFGGDAGEGEGVVDEEGGFVFGEFHFGFDARGAGGVGGDDFGEGEFGGGFVMEVEVGEFLASGGEGVEAGGRVVGGGRLWFVRVPLALPDGRGTGGSVFARGGAKGMRGSSRLRLSANLVR